MPRRIACVVAAVVGTILVGAWMAAAAAEEFRSSETKSFVVGVTPDISVETVNGDVSYVATEGTTATVTIETIVRAENETEAGRIRDGIKIIVEGGDGFLTARIEYPDGFERWLRRIFGPQRSIGVSFHIRGPEGADGVLSSVSGDVEVEGVLGRLELISVSGDLNARRLGARLRANSTSGGVHVEESAAAVSIRTVSGDQWIESCGALDAHSVSGNILGRSIRGEVDIGTVSGDVTIDDVGAGIRVGTTSGEIHAEQRAGGFDLHTTSGDITIQSSAPEAPLIARSTSGEINVIIDPAAIGDVTLETSSGDIQADLEMTVRQHSRRRLVGRVGSGDRELKVSTVSGDIVLREL